MQLKYNAKTHFLYSMRFYVIHILNKYTFNIHLMLQMVSQNTHSKYCNKPYMVTRLIQKLLYLIDLSGYLKRLETITRIKLRIRVDT